MRSVPQNAKHQKFGNLCLNTKNEKMSSEKCGLKSTCVGICIFPMFLGGKKVIRENIETLKDKDNAADQIHQKAERQGKFKTAEKKSARANESESERESAESASAFTRTKNSRP